MNELAIPAVLMGEKVEQGFALSVRQYAESQDDPNQLSQDQSILSGLVGALSGRGREKKEAQSAQLLVEVRIGELLGPNPGMGVGGGGDSTVATDNSAMPLTRELRHSFRRLAWNVDGTNRTARAQHWISEGKTARKPLIDLLDEEYRTEHRDPDAITVLDIRQGDFIQVLADLPNDSVDLILTDPPYAVEHLNLWSDLAIFAARKLKPGGSLIAYSGQSTLFEAHARLEEQLRYWWTCALTHGQSQRLPGKWVIVGWKPILWFVKDTLGQKHFVADKVNGSGARSIEHEWAQGTDEVRGFIEALTEPGDLIVDPMAGSGSFGYTAVELDRRFIGAEIREL